MINHRTLLLPAILFASTQFVHAQGVTTADIVDPKSSLKAFTITIPAGWKFQGTVVPGPGCSQVPSPAFRAYSPDGLTELRLMPAFNWTFHPNVKNFHVAGCLEIGSTLTAEEFLQRFEEMMPADSGLHVVGPMPIAANYQARVDKIANNMNHMNPNIRGSATAAAVRVETHNGSFTIEQRLRAYVECRITDPKSGMPPGGGCSAHVDVLRAPKGKLDAVAQFVDEHDMVRTPHEDAWLQTVLVDNRRYSEEMSARLTAQQRAGSAMLKRQFDDFMATSQRNHQAFMAQQESSFRSSMNNATRNMNARTTAASDWVDYALDQQTVTGSGGTVKVSNAYGHTWSNGQNEWYQTNDPNANPNGVLSGNWTENTKVHGNGQPY